MKVLLIGASRVNQQLLARLSEAWVAVVIDTDEAALQTARSVRDVSVVLGDGASRVTLERAGIDDADALIASTDDDDVNIEACRIALAASVEHVAALAYDADRLEEYRAIGVPAYSRDQLAARHLEAELGPRGIAARSFADGHGELVELRVLADSPAVGHTVQDLPRGGWLIAAVLREGTLVIPRGDTMIRAGDEISIITSAADYVETIRVFTAAGQRFPLQFGNHIAVARVGGRDQEFAEAAYLTRNSLARSLVVAAVDEPPGVPGVDVSRMEPGHNPNASVLAAHHGAGLVVVPAPAEGIFAGFAARRLTRFARRRHVAVLVSRGRSPYQTILVPARDTADGHLAAFVATDLARATGARLVGVSVAAPDFLDGPDAKDDALRTARGFRESAALQGVEAEIVTREGNPARGILQVANEHAASLIVLGVAQNRAPWQVDLPAHVMRHAAASVLLVPAAS